MSVQYLLDTNTVSGIIRKRSSRLAQKLRTVSSASLMVSVITEAEILFGLARNPEATRLAQDAQQVLKRLPTLAWTSQTARTYAALRHATERRGTGISAMDLLIASQAYEKGLTLVTNDLALRELKDLLPVEDWL